MITIDNLSDDAFQKVDVVLDDGSLATIALRYLPSGQRWIADITAGSFTVRAVGLCNHPNLLRQFRNTLSFGLMCLTIDGVDPAYIQDFVNGRCQLLVLTKADVAALENDLMKATA